MQTKNCYSTRVGALAKKLGMTRMKINDKMLPVTLLHLENCKVVDHIVEEKRGYNAALVGIGALKNVNKPQLKDKGNFALLKEFRSNLELPTDEIKADYFALEQKVDVSGVSKGKGFQGGMKKHGFHGLRATHGVSVSHRSLGSTGNRTEPGRVFKGRKMPGHMGNDRVTTQGLTVIYINTEHNVVGVLGCVPGSKNSYVEIRDSFK